MRDFKETRQLLHDSSYYYIICTNMQGTYSYVNNRYAAVFSKIHGDIIGKPYQITMHPSDTKVCEEVAAKCFQHPDKTFPATIRKHDGKGGYIITQWEYKAMWDDDNQPLGIFCLGFDITEYTLIHSELENTKDALEKSHLALREIAFNQSHLVRSPLSNILGIGYILERMDLDQNLRNLCNMLVESSRQLDEVVKKIVYKTSI